MEEKNVRKNRRIFTGILLTMIIPTVIGVSALTRVENYHEIVSEEDKEQYSFNVSNILDNVFTKDGKNIIPFIFKTPEQSISKNYVIDQLKKEGITVKNITNVVNGNVTTGSVVTTNYKTYTILIYGDIDPDGIVDIFDAAKIVNYVYGKGNLTGLYRIAANVDDFDDDIDIFDAAKVVNFVYDATELVSKSIQPKPDAKKALVITIKGSSKITLEYGAAYTDAGAIVTNPNTLVTYQPKVTIQKNGITVSSVNTKSSGTYQIIYSYNGAKSVTRTVIVKEKPAVLTSIEIETLPNKVEYVEKQSVKLDGIVVNGIYSDGTKKQVSISQLSTDITKVEMSTTQIEVKYQNFTASYPITVYAEINDFIINLPQTKELEVSDEYVSIGTIQSNEPRDIWLEEFSFTILNNKPLEGTDGVFIKAVEQNKQPGVYDIMVKSNQAGVYSFNIHVGTKQTIASTTIQFKEAVVKAKLIPENDTPFMQGESKILGIVFEDKNGNIVDVKRGDIAITPSYIQYLDEDKVTIGTVGEIVKYIEITPKQLGQLRISVKVKGREVLNTTITVEKKPIEVEEIIVTPAKNLVFNINEEVTIGTIKASLNGAILNEEDIVMSVKDNQTGENIGQDTISTKLISMGEIEKGAYRMILNSRVEGTYDITITVGDKADTITVLFEQEKIHKIDHIQIVDQVGNEITQIPEDGILATVHFYQGNQIVEVTRKDFNMQASNATISYIGEVGEIIDQNSDEIIKKLYIEPIDAEQSVEVMMKVTGMEQAIIKQMSVIKKLVVSELQVVPEANLVFNMNENSLIGTVTPILSHGNMTQEDIGIVVRNNKDNTEVSKENVSVMLENVVGTDNYKISLNSKITGIYNIVITVGDKTETITVQFKEKSAVIDKIEFVDQDGNKLTQIAGDGDVLNLVFYRGDESVKVARKDLNVQITNANIIYLGAVGEIEDANSEETVEKLYIEPLNPNENVTVTVQVVKMEQAIEITLNVI